VFVCDVAVFVLKRDVKVQPTNQPLDGGAHWHNLANTIKPCAAVMWPFFQITLTNCSYFELILCFVVCCLVARTVYSCVSLQ